jgi:hypothetical protein
MALSCWLSDRIAKVTERSWTRIPGIEADGRGLATAGAKSYARVTRDAVHVWYGTGEEDTASLVWRPFDRSELGR